MVDHLLATIAAGLLAAAGLPAAAQGPAARGPAPPSPVTAVIAEPAGAVEQEPAAWQLAASVYGYFVPDDVDYAQPTLSADRGWLHLEARYNYEDLDTFSGWLGYRFAFGDELSLIFTPMIGGVVGDTTGFAPGLELAFDWGWLGIYSESEWVVDVDERDDSFAYTWSEITVSPTGWLRAGMVVQRTRTHDAGRDVDRGILLSVMFDAVAITGHVFNPDLDRPTWVLAFEVDF